MYHCTVFLLFAICGWCNGNPGARILRGESADIRSYPYMVSLKNEDKHFCGGVIVGDRWILTAAYCVLNNHSSGDWIYVGSSTLDGGGVPCPFKKVIVHEDYNPDLISNDIALIKLGSTFPFDENIQPIALPEADTGDDVSAEVLGWGYTSYPGELSNQLQKNSVTTVNLMECQKKLRYHGYIFTWNICAETNEGKGTACNGDTGGPLVVDDTLIGLVSWGVPCGEDYPDAYTRVYYYIDWIKDKIKNDNDDD